jgi:hypothetical protein
VVGSCRWSRGHAGEVSWSRHSLRSGLQGVIMVREMNLARCSSTDQGEGKRRAVIADYRRRLKLIKTPAIKSAQPSTVTARRCRSHWPQSAQENGRGYICVYDHAVPM